MGWVNKKTGKVYSSECAPCMDCKALTDHKTGFCFSCRDKRGLVKKKKPLVSKEKAAFEIRNYLK